MRDVIGALVIIAWPTIGICSAFATSTKDSWDRNPIMTLALAIWCGSIAGPFGLLWLTKDAHE